ncbi:MAG: hypothetical protein OSA92_17355, partial [Pirellulaceae bacterium]|nr:hypothetical protein [Pirellulaceae bacterium]
MKLIGGRLITPFITQPTTHNTWSCQLLLKAGNAGEPVFLETGFFECVTIAYGQLGSRQIG